MVLAVEQMMMNADTGISEVASAVKRQGWMQVSHADEGSTGLLPDGQLEQEAEPEKLLYLPTVQLVHGPPSGPLEPALHVHALLLALPEGEVERDGQLEQAPEPVLILYVPVTHAVHVPPSVPV